MARARQDREDSAGLPATIPFPSRDGPELRVYRMVEVGDEVHQLIVSVWTDDRCVVSLVSLTTGRACRVLSCEESEDLARSGPGRLQAARSPAPAPR